MAVSSSAFSVVVFLSAVFLLGSIPVHAGQYPEQEGRHNITTGVKGFRDILLYSDEPSLTSKPFQKQSYDICYPHQDKNDRVHIIYYSVVAVKKEGLAYLNKKLKSDNSRVCFHLKTLRGEGYHFKVEVWGTKY